VFALQDPFSLNSHPRIAAIAYPRRSSSWRYSCFDIRLAIWSGHSDRFSPDVN
jgi:hypothetical protein